MDAHQPRAIDAPSTRAGIELFDLTVTLGPGLVPWVSAVSRLGHVHGIPRRDSAVPPIDDLVDLVFDYVDAVRFAELEPELTLAGHLGHLVFGEPSVLELFQATRGAAADRGREVLVRILASPHFAVLPWELLPDPVHRGSAADRRYLALAPDASVTRLARGRTYPVRGERLDPPLNLLFVVSSPIARHAADDSLAFDIYEEKRSLLAELKPLVDAGLLHVDVEEQPSLENLRRRIGAQRRGYHLLHYLGHALPDRLILEDEQGRRDDQSGARFTEILRLCPDLRLAVFAGCETARAPQDPIALDAAGTTEWRDIFSLADRAVQDSCPMVVGMQAVLPFRTERLFTRFFYQGLASGYSVTAALRLARGATRGDRHVGGDLLDWSVPVLFLGGSEPGPLLDRSVEGKPPAYPPRHVLRVGLRQRETRFFARDVPLRQAIDILAGDTPERVLLLTGAAGVGKTLLIDRALEELRGPVFILYIRLKELVPELDVDRAALLHGDGPVLRVPDGFRADTVLERLGRLVASVLQRADGRRREPDAGRPVSEWWQSLVEDVTGCRFVLVLDEADLLTALEEAFLRRLAPHWLAPLLEDVAGRFKPEDVPYLLDDLIERLRDPDIEVIAPANRPNDFVNGLPEFQAMLPARRFGMLARRALAARTQQVLEGLRDAPLDTTVLPRLKAAVSNGATRADIGVGLETLAAVRDVLDRALRSIADLRSPARVAVAGSELPDDFLKIPPEWRFEMRLGHLTWSETSRWIRRNLPGLLRYGDEYLCRLWSDLGPELERWEELERRVLLLNRDDQPLSAIAGEIAPRRRTRAQANQNGTDTRPRGERPLRLAIAGPHVAGPDAVAIAVTRLAAMHGVGGRVMAGVARDIGSLAVLIEEPSPFAGAGTATAEAVFEWLNRVIAREPDLVLLDYGSWHEGDAPPTDSIEQRMLRMVRHRSLLIAAGANEDVAGMMQVPAAYREVLSVGPLRDDGQLHKDYSVWWPQLRKPDLFMADQLLGTPLEEALVASLRADEYDPDKANPLGPGTHGSSFAALHAVAAAILVWATIPDLTPRGVRRILTDAASPIPGTGDPAARGLRLEDALKRARQELVRRTLRGGPCSLHAMVSITGLDVGAALETLTELTNMNPPQVRWLPRGRLERYELIGA